MHTVGVGDAVRKSGTPSLASQRESGCIKTVAVTGRAVKWTGPASRVHEHNGSDGNFAIRQYADPLPPATAGVILEGCEEPFTNYLAEAAFG